LGTSSLSADPYCLEGEGHRCSYSPTGFCKADIDQCAKATGSVIADGTQLQARLSGGTDGVIYKVSFKAATSLGYLYEQDIVVGVAD
jgi:hypothetical protein